MIPKITIIWRPNVGKSSFFNMFTKQKIAIISDERGATRDISEFEYTDQDHKITYIIRDSWWLDFGTKDSLVARDIIDKTSRAIEDSDILIWIVEYDKFTLEDEDILKIIRSGDLSKVIVVANKADNDSFNLQAYSLPIVSQFEHFIPVSTAHNLWFNEVRKTIYKLLKGIWKTFYLDYELDGIKISLVWRPNVWKSSLINAILNEDRLMVQDFSGTTRDSIDTSLNYKDNNITLIDTAWLRRLSKVGIWNIESWSVLRTERSIKRSDIVWVVIDGVEWIHNKDLSIIWDVMEQWKWLFVVVNKWDKVMERWDIDKDRIMPEYAQYLSKKLDFGYWIPVIFTSAVSKKNVYDILDEALKIDIERSEKRVKTSIFNEFLAQMTINHPPTGTRKSHNPRIYYGSQVDNNPPKFIISVNDPDSFHFSYKRYLENRIRDNFWFEWTPIIIEYRWRWKNKDKTK